MIYNKKQPKDEIIELKMPSRKEKVMFWICTSSTILLVLVGWGFSMRDAVADISLQVPGASQLPELQESWNEAASAVKINTEEPLENLQQALQPLADDLKEKAEAEEEKKKEEALDAVTDVMIRKIEDEIASEAEAGAKAGAGSAPETVPDGAGVQGAAAVTANADSTN